MSDKEDDDKSKHDNSKSPFSLRRAKKLLVLSEYLSKQESRNTSIKVSRILKKGEDERTEEEKQTLLENQDIAKRIHKNKEKRQLSEQRIQEIEDSEEDLQKKCEALAKAIQESKRTVIYTGAGISTAASIPDYRGPQGVWTLLQKGEQLKPQDLSDAEPTFTHMCITKLHQEGHVSHVVSQNCDGLHLRSGLPRRSLSEVHGNMFIEVCYHCKPHREYIRLFDVTENTGVRRHDTGRKCYRCGSKLRDTIVHFGEKGGLKSPYRWKEAGRAANKADLIICLGSSLKILKKYACLWCMDRAKNQRPDLVIVNLQWTPKDDSSTLKIHGRCDDVLSRVLTILGYTIPNYSRDSDPIFRLATCLSEDEFSSTAKKVLQKPACLQRLRSARDYRTPTPSESESSSCSSSSSADSQTDGTLSEEIDMEEIIKEIKGKEQARKMGKPQNKEESYQIKSERICLEALQAMQAKQANLQTADIARNQLKCLSRTVEKLSPNKSSNVKSVAALNSSKAINLASTISGLQDRLAQQQQQQSQHQQPSQQPEPQTLYLNHHLVKSINRPSGKQVQHQNIPGDPLVGSPFDPGPTHQQKLQHLQMLQVQLEALKQKQKQMKELEYTGPQQAQMVSGTLKLAEQQSPLAASQSDASLPYQVLQQLYSSVQPTSLSQQSLQDKVTSPDNKNGLLLLNMNEAAIKPQLPDNKVSVKMVSLLDQKEVLSPEKQPICVKLEVKQETRVNQAMLDQSNQEIQLAALGQKFEKEMNDLQTYQEAESSRLYQLHLVQHQVLEQSNTSPKKLNENRQLFVQQQQLLAHHQNSQTQELAQRHQLEYNMQLATLSQAQEKQSSVLAGSVTQGTLSFHNYSHASSQLPSSSHLPKSVSLPSKVMAGSCARTKVGISQCMTDGSSNLHHNAKIKLDTELKVDVSLVKKSEGMSSAHKPTLTSPQALLSPGRTDFSIDAIIHSPSTSTQSVPAKIPGFSELVDKLMQCESCRFLSDYGISKQRCSKCSDLKVRHTVLHSQVILASDENPKSTFQEVPNLNTHQTRNTVSSYLPTSVSPGSNSRTLHNQIYLTNTESSNKGSNASCTIVSPAANTKTLATDCSSTVSVASTSIIHVKDSGPSDNHELSPIIPYAGGSSRQKQKTMQNNAPVISLNNSCILQQIEASSIDAANEPVEQMCKKSGSDTLKPITGEIVFSQRPHRSHSVSEIYDKQGQITLNELEESRLARSMSTDEVGLLETQEGMDDKGDDSSPVKQDEVTKGGKKRKQSSQVSVPGWFGKGLNLKKRRRY